MLLTERQIKAAAYAQQKLTAIPEACLCCPHYCTADKGKGKCAVLIALRLDCPVYRMLLRRGGSGGEPS